MLKVVAQRTALTVLFLGVYLGLWSSIKFGFGIADYLVPSPRSVLSAAFDPSQRLFFHAWITLNESFFGFAAANAIAFAAGVASYLSRTVRAIVIPLGITLKTTPVVAIAPLLIIWLGSGFHTRVIASAVICFFPMLIGVYESMTQTPRPLVEYYKSLQATRLEEVFHLRLPYAIPDIFTALRVSSTLSIVGAVVAEMIGATSGLGYVIVLRTYSFQTASTFAAVIMAACCGFVLYGGVLLVQAVVGVSRWRS